MLGHASGSGSTSSASAFSISGSSLAHSIARRLHAPCEQVFRRRLRLNRPAAIGKDAVRDKAVDATHCLAIDGNCNLDAAHGEPPGYDDISAYQKMAHTQAVWIPAAAADAPALRAITPPITRHGRSGDALKGEQGDGLQGDGHSACRASGAPARARSGAARPRPPSCRPETNRRIAETAGRLSRMPARRIGDRALAASQTPIMSAPRRTGASLVTMDRPIGERHSSPIVCSRYADEPLRPDFAHDSPRAALCDHKYPRNPRQYDLPRPILAGVDSARSRGPVPARPHDAKQRDEQHDHKPGPAVR